MKNTKTRELTILAMLCSITILLGIIPNIGIIQIGPVSFTILHIPVIIAAIIYKIKGGAIVGLVFGITSWFVAVTRAYTPIDLLFINPLVSIVPRVLFGLFTGFISKLIISDKKNAIKSSLIAFISTFAHSLLVYFFIYIFGKQEIALAAIGVTENILLFLLSIFSLNALVEAAVASIIVFVVIKSLNLNKKIL